MGTLATRISHIDTVRDTIKPVLDHFARLSLSKDIEQSLALAADLAFSDELLFEKFQMWYTERDDETFLFHINRFFQKRDQKPLATTERDLTQQRELVETAIKDSVRTRQKQIFGQRITRLATERSLVTNDQLGEFLGVSGEQARKFKAGENKPQLATLKNIADRFKVSVEYLIGLSEER
jgi:hypothetical protein